MRHESENKNGSLGPEFFNESKLKRTDLLDIEEES